MKAFGLICCVLVAVGCTWVTLIFSIRTAFFPTVDGVAEEVAPRRVESSKNIGFSPPTRRTPSEEVTGQVRPTPHPGLSPESVVHRMDRMESDVQRREASKSELERVTESHKRKLADLKRGLISPSIRVTNAANTMEEAVRKFQTDEQVFETQMEINKRNSILQLPTPPLPQLPDAQQIAGLDSAIIEFEKDIGGYISGSKEAVFEFYRQTKGVKREGEADRDWLEEALEVPEVSRAFFICHARQRLVDVYSSGRFDLWPNLAGVAQPQFTFGCVKSINEVRFARDRGYSPCFIDKELLVVAQDHAEEMARVDKTLPTFVVDNPGVSKRLLGGIAVKAINSFCVCNEQLPAQAAMLINYILKQSSGAVLLSQENSVGLGSCRSDTGKWYISLLIAPR